MQTKLNDGSIMVCGILPKDAEYKVVGQHNSSLTTFGVKVGERPSPDINQRADAIWCNCVCWHNVARAAMHLKKGDCVLCIGKIKVEDYTDRNGNPVKSKKLECEFVAPMVSAQIPAQQTQQNASVGDLSEYEEILSGGDPF